MGINVTYHLIIGSPIPNNISRDVWDSMVSHSELDAFLDWQGDTGHFGLSLVQSIDHRDAMGGLEGTSDLLYREVKLRDIEKTLDLVNRILYRDFRNIFDIPSIWFVCVIN